MFKFTPPPRNPVQLCHLRLTGTSALATEYTEGNLRAIPIWQANSGRKVDRRDIEAELGQEREEMLTDEQWANSWDERG